MSTARIAADDLTSPWSGDIGGAVHDQDCSLAETTRVGCGDVVITITVKDIWRLGLEIYEISYGENLCSVSSRVHEIAGQLLDVNGLFERRPDGCPESGEINERVGDITRSVDHGDGEIARLLGCGIGLVSHESTGGFRHESGGGRRGCENYVAGCTGVDPKNVEGTSGIVEHVRSSAIAGCFADGGRSVFLGVEEETVGGPL